jgi:hypothetical protein
MRVRVDGAGEERATREPEHLRVLGQRGAVHDAAVRVHRQAFAFAERAVAVQEIREKKPGDRHGR